MTLFTQTNYQPKNKSVFRLVNAFESQYSDVFSKVKLQWLPAIREFLREETGLRMHQKVMGMKIQKDSNISFSFVADREEAFIKLIDQNFPDLDFEEYSSFAKLNIEIKNSDKFFKSNKNNPRQQFELLSSHLDEYFHKYDLKVLLETLFNNSGETADIWGAYFYGSSRIEVYYIPLILFCQINSLPLEYAILSTLVHEMAHAYHHVGRDKDNIMWRGMAATDKFITEGMAEYFTWLFVEAYKNDHPGMEKTYVSMFDCLSEEYTSFKKWTPVYTKETIKSALLGTRRRSITGYNDFKTLLTEVQKVMQ